MSPTPKALARFVARHFPYRPRLNRLARAIVRPLIPLLPEDVARAIPVVGTISARLPGGGRVLMETAGDDLIAAAVYRRGVMGFEGPTFRVFLHLLAGVQTFFDIGANTGLFALVAGRLSPACSVRAFEPVPAVSARLRRNIEINALPNVTAEELALSDRPGEMTLFVPNHAALPTSSSLKAGFRQDVREIQTAVTTLDAYVAEHSIPRVDLLKIDTEATEHLVLAGGRETLRRDRPAIICEVLQGRCEAQLQPLLEELGYRFYHIEKTGPAARADIRGDNGDSNYLFLHNEDRRRALVEGWPASTEAAGGGHA